MKHIKLFEQFIAENAELNEKFTYADACDTAGEECNDKDIAAALKFLKAKTAKDIKIVADTTSGANDLNDAIKDMEAVTISSPVYDKAYSGKYKGKDVVVFDGGEDLFAYSK